MAGKKGQKNRFWSDDEKRSICAQASVPGISIAQVARRYSMNTNLIHKWLKDPRFAPEAVEGDVGDEGTGFLPVEIECVASLPGSTHPPIVQSALHTPLSAQRVDITLSDGRRILVEGSTALSAVLALVEGLIV
jgi:transposase